MIQSSVLSVQRAKFPPQQATLSFNIPTAIALYIMESDPTNAMALANIKDALNEAFTCYLGILSRVHSLHDTKLPCKGKSVQTESDISAEKGFRSRIAAAELCLKYIPDIAANIFHWSSEWEPSFRSQGDLEDTEIDSTAQLDSVSTFGSFLPDFDEEELIDIFSGRLIVPITPFSPESSGTKRSSLLDSSKVQNNMQVSKTL